jgi:hypothetical protein
MRKNPWRNRKTRAAILRGIRRAARKRRQDRTTFGNPKSLLSEWTREINRDFIRDAFLRIGYHYEG